MLWAWLTATFGRQARESLGIDAPVPVVVTPEFWERMAAGIAGAALILVGLFIILYSQPETKRAMQSAAGAVTTVATRGVIK